MTLNLNRKQWNTIVAQVIATDGVARMKRVADACNTAAGTDEYKLSVEGPGPTLQQRDYRVTVITAGYEAIVDNALHNRLLSNFHLAGGG